MTDAKLSGEVYRSATGAWHQYMSDIGPLRPMLFGYCRRLTGNPWDADDLVQETMMRGFSILGLGQDEIEDLRAYLLRVASNAWIDWQRRRATEAATVNQIAANPAVRASSVDDIPTVRDAGMVLMQMLAPQERAAVVLKDLFDMSLEESARILGTSIGAIKAALHRGRARLQDARSARPKPRMNPSKEDVLLSVMRLEAIDDRVSRIRSYAFSPELLDEVAHTLGLRRSPAMYSFSGSG